MTEKSRTMASPRSHADELVRRLGRPTPDPADTAWTGRTEQGRHPRRRTPGPPELIGQAVDAALDGIAAMLAAQGAPPPAALDAFRALGQAHAREGRDPDDLRAALSLAVGMAAERLARQSPGDGLACAPEQAGAFARLGLEYIDRLRRAATTARAWAGVANAEDPYRRDDPDDACRCDLIGVLLSSPCDPARLHRAAVLADWKIPKTLAVVAMCRPLGPASARRFLPPDVLTGLHQGLPCLIFPDPAGPGRRSTLQALLGDGPSVVGPTVETLHAESSWRLARRGLESLPLDLLSQRSAVHVIDHARDLLLLQDHALSRELAARKLAPLQRLRPARRARLAETLLAYLECGRNAAAIAARLHTHPQTIRHRLRQITDLFGSDIDDPAQALDYLIALHTWRLLPDEQPHRRGDPPDGATLARPHTTTTTARDDPGGGRRRAPRTRQRKAAPHEP